MSEAQWVDWYHLESMESPIYDQVIATCERMHIKKLMAFKYDWNVEVVAQFYATLYIEEAGSVRQMHWMTCGRQYSISFTRFARLFGFGQVDLSRERIHIGHPLPREEIEFMYPPHERQHAGSVSQLYIYYSVLNRLFRKTLTPRDGNTSDITLFAKNLLARMRDGATAFSVADQAHIHGSPEDLWLCTVCDVYDRGGDEV